MLSSDQQTLVVLRVGETTNPPGLLAANVALVAAQYDGLDQRTVALGSGLAYSLEMLYTQRDLIFIAMGACRANVQTKTATADQYLQQEAARLEAMRAATVAEIRHIELLVAHGTVPVSGQLTVTTPIIDPYPDATDAMDPALRGSPYYRYPQAPGLIDRGLPLNTQQ